MFFDHWEKLGRIALLGLCAYALVLLVLRLTGKRTLGALNAADLVVTVAIGNLLAMVMLDSDVVLADFAVAIVTLAVVSVTLDWWTLKRPQFGHLLESKPALVYFKGEFLRAVLARERLTEAEVLTAMREHGVASCDQVDAIVIESSGALSVIERGRLGSMDALRGVDDKESKLSSVSK